MNETIQQKQNFLRTNILEKGYDGNQFVEFLTKKKGPEGADISSWTLHDLQIVNYYIYNLFLQCVNEFIQIHQTKQQNQNASNANKINHPQQPQPQPNINNQKNLNDNSNVNKQPQKNIPIQNNSQKTIQKPPQQQQLNPNQNVNNINKNIPPQNITNKPNISNINSQSNQKIVKPKSKPEKIEFRPEVSCKSIEITGFGKTKKIKITVGSPEKIEGGFLQKSYITYLINTLPFDFKVRRRYSDFEWLRQNLILFYPDCVVPSIPKKNYGDRFNELFIIKRAKTLEKFLNNVLMDPILRNSSLLYDFLTLEKETAFSNKKNSIKKSDAPTVIENFVTLDGKAKLEFTNENEKYFINIKNFANDSEAVLKNICTNIKNLNSEILTVLNTIHEISILFLQLQGNSLKYKDNPDVIESYKICGKMFKDFEEKIRKENIILNVNLKEYFKFRKNRFRTINELGERVQQCKFNYLKGLDKLIDKKEEYYKKDMSKWELDYRDDSYNRADLLRNKKLAFSKMFPKDTKSVLHLRELYGFYLNRFIYEYERIKGLSGAKQTNKFIEFWDKFKLIDDNYKKNLEVNFKELNNIKEKQPVREDEDFPIELEKIINEINSNYKSNYENQKKNEETKKIDSKEKENVINKNDKNLNNVNNTKNEEEKEKKIEEKKEEETNKNENKIDKEEKKEDDKDKKDDKNIKLTEEHNDNNENEKVDEQIIKNEENNIHNNNLFDNNNNNNEEDVLNNNNENILNNNNEEDVLNNNNNEEEKNNLTNNDEQQNSNES